ncbi:MAG: CGNR zinc finger domain-containing protein [Rhizobiaceae bacterium]|nr:CGNR zinc finger domain-containing protein [Rhizobiaceae bacterium]
MNVEWTEHRFAGGVLALDVANTVVLRGDPDRSFDRFADPQEIPRFAEVASFMRKEELEGSVLLAQPESRQIIPLREATDRLFRHSVECGQLEPARLSVLLNVCSEAVSRAGPLSLNGASQRGAVPLESAVAMSALGLLRPERLARLRICANCRWLFLDRSKNASRIWCDMSVCGNRRKAARHYKKSQSRSKDESDAAY